MDTPVRLFLGWFRLRLLHYEAIYTNGTAFPLKYGSILSWLVMHGGALHCQTQVNSRART